MLIVFILVTVLLVTSSVVDFGFKDKEVQANNGVASHVRNPRRSNNVTTWDCVYFGRYKQTKNDDGVGDYTGDYYKEAIKWRVLEKKDGELFLLADQSLDSVQYNGQWDKKNPETGELDLSWANSDLREWLNDDFYNEAFNSDEKADISLTTVTADKPRHKPDMDEGPDTQDYVYILSMEEALNTKYGFVDNYIDSDSSTGNAEATDTRSSVNTDYCYRFHPSWTEGININDPDQPEVKVQGKPWILPEILSKPYGNYRKCGIWWMRTVKSKTTIPYYMYRSDYDGSIKQKPGPENNACVRPVIKVDQDSDCLHYAGTTNSNGEMTGYCGDDATYELKNNVLTISGSGPMYDFGAFEAPWHKYSDEIYTIVVGGSVTSVGTNAFADCEYATYMYLNDSVSTIAQNAFSDIEMDDSMFISVAENSTAESICSNYGWNYTTVRSEDPLCVEIREIRDTIETEDTLTFKFDNPCVGQHYRVYKDNVLEDTIIDTSDIIEYTLIGTSGRHEIKITAFVEGSEGKTRESHGKVIRTHDDGFGDPVWEDRSNVKKKWRCRWNTLYFGRYPQTEDPDGDYTCTDYTGTTRTFKTEPIKWRVLEHRDDELLLLADKSLDNRQFDKKNKNVWATSSLRAWLNNDDSSASDPGFIARAFNEQEKAALLETDTPTNTESSGGKTKDKVFLIGWNEIWNEDYGFLKPGEIKDGKQGYENDSVFARVRRSQATNFAIKDCGQYDPNGGTLYKWPWYENMQTYKKDGKNYTDNEDTYHDRATIWWFRDKGKQKGVDTTSNNSCARANFAGNLDEMKAAEGINAMVRPMIKIRDDSKAIVDAGTINSDGETHGPVDYYNVYIDGKLDKRVKEGTTYTLPEESTKRSTLNGTNIGYIDVDSPDSVYAKGTSFSINRDRSFSKIARVSTEPAGTAIRLVKGQSHGLAFQCQTTVTAESNPGDNPIHSKAFEYGTLVTTYDDYADVYDNELDVDTQQVEGHPIYNVKFGEQDFTKKPQLYIVGITNLRQQNYAREYVARPYVIIKFEGTSESAVVYPDESTPLFVKSAKQVAENLMKSDKWKTGGYTAWQKEWITSYTILE